MPCYNRLRTLYMGKRESEKMQTLLLEYIKDFDIAKAAKRTGVTRNEARRIIEDSPGEIARLIEERTMRTEIDADWVLMQLKDAFMADLLEVLYPDGTVRPVQEWPSTWRRIASGVKVKEQVDKSGNYTGRVIEFKTPDALRILELIGKHVDISAFSERLEIGTQADLAERLRRGRERLVNAQRERLVHENPDGTATIDAVPEGYDLPAPEEVAPVETPPVSDEDDDADVTADPADETADNAPQAAGMSFL